MTQRTGGDLLGRKRLARWALLAAALLLLVAGCGTGPAPTALSGLSSRPVDPNIHKIQHVIVLDMENRSFDSYFGTYPGADGIPMRNGTPAVCSPDPRTHTCTPPYIDHADSNSGGPHNAANNGPDVAGGAMNGFVAQAESTRQQCSDPTDPNCVQAGRPVDVMGYHPGTDIPNYWAYAGHYALQDHMFESTHSWSFTSHLYLVSGWAANCPVPTDPGSCRSNIDPQDRTPTDPTPFGWTDLTYLLHSHNISWSYYLDHGAQPPSAGTQNRHPAQAPAGPPRPGPAPARSAAPPPASPKAQHGVPKIWNPLPGFVDTHTDNQTQNITSLDNYYTAAAAGRLPAISWVVPNSADSEHPPARISTGQAFATNVINAAMRSPDWPSTAIFLTWDDWGGFYDHLPPPSVDGLGYGIRVPGLVISPYSKTGYIDHQNLSYDAYLKFIEDDFLGGARLDPATDGRPDPRPDVRENQPLLGDVTADFNFNQPPQPPVMLSPTPPTTLTGLGSPAAGPAPNTRPTPATAAGGDDG